MENAGIKARFSNKEYKRSKQNDLWQNKKEKYWRTFHADCVLIKIINKDRCLWHDINHDFTFVKHEQKSFLASNSHKNRS